MTLLPSKQIWGSCPLVKDDFNLFSFSSDFFVNTEHVSLFFSLNLKLHTVKSQSPCASDSRRELCHKHGSGRTELKDPALELSPSFEVDLGCVPFRQACLCGLLAWERKPRKAIECLGNQEKAETCFCAFKLQ